MKLPPPEDGLFLAEPVPVSPVLGCRLDSLIVGPLSTFDTVNPIVLGALGVLNVPEFEGLVAE